MTSKLSIVLTAFAAGIAAQPVDPATAAPGLSTAAAAGLNNALPLRPSTAAVDKFKGLIQEAAGTKAGGGTSTSGWRESAFRRSKGGTSGQ